MRRTDYLSTLIIMVFRYICAIILLLFAGCGARNTGRVFSDGNVALGYRHTGNERPASVYLSGSFNDWLISDPRFKCEWDPAEEKYSIAFRLVPGRYEYRFVVDGRWVHDPDARESAPDPLGGRLGVFYVTQPNPQ
ncbi:MAG: glycogen-binding domain-containing protein [Spirochaetota bacterium]|jgi:hypothetical protein|nr:glycogen-binding domain-containing protein [Spirochaetota bacterium]